MYCIDRPWVPESHDVHLGGIIDIKMIPELISAIPKILIRNDSGVIGLIGLMTD